MVDYSLGGIPCGVPQINMPSVAWCAGPSTHKFFLLSEAKVGGYLPAATQVDLVFSGITRHRGPIGPQLQAILVNVTEHEP